METLAMPGGMQMLPLIVGAEEGKADADQPQTDEIEDAELLIDGPGSGPDEKTSKS
jgi:HemY protein